MGGSFDVVVVETGANDGLRGTPVATIERNVREIVRRIQTEHPTATILPSRIDTSPSMTSKRSFMVRMIPDRIRMEPAM